MTNNQAFEFRDATIAYLRDKYGRGDLNWHPLFQAVRELFCAVVR